MFISSVSSNIQSLEGFGRILNLHGERSKFGWAGSSMFQLKTVLSIFFWINWREQCVYVTTYLSETTHPLWTSSLTTLLISFSVRRFSRPTCPRINSSRSQLRERVRERIWTFAWYLVVRTPYPSDLGTNCIGIELSQLLEWGKEDIVLVGHHGAK